MGSAKLLTARREPLPARARARPPLGAHHGLPPGGRPAPDSPRADGPPADPRRLHRAARPGGSGALAAGHRRRPEHPGGGLAAHLEDQAAAIGRWARHIADPADVETYV